MGVACYSRLPIRRCSTNSQSVTPEEGFDAGRNLQSVAAREPTRGGVASGVRRGEMSVTLEETARC